MRNDREIEDKILSSYRLLVELCDDFGLPNRWILSRRIQSFSYHAGITAAVFDSLVHQKRTDVVIPTSIASQLTDDEYYCYLDSFWKGYEWAYKPLRKASVSGKLSHVRDVMFSIIKEFWSGYGEGWGDVRDGVSTDNKNTVSQSSFRKDYPYYSDNEVISLHKRWLGGYNAGYNDGVAYMAERLSHLENSVRSDPAEVARLNKRVAMLEQELAEQNAMRQQVTDELQAIQNEFYTNPSRDFQDDYGSESYQVPSHRALVPHSSSLPVPARGATRAFSRPQQPTSRRWQRLWFPIRVFIMFVLSMGMISFALGAILHTDNMGLLQLLKGVFSVVILCVVGLFHIVKSRVWYDRLHILLPVLLGFGLFLYSLISGRSFFTNFFPFYAILLVLLIGELIFWLIIRKK